MITEDADCFVAIGAALAGKDGEIFNEEKLLQALAKVNDAPLDAVAKLPPLFADEADYEKFCCRHAQHQVEREALAAYNGNVIWVSIPVRQL